MRGVPGVNTSRDPPGGPARDSQNDSRGLLHAHSMSFLAWQSNQTQAFGKTALRTLCPILSRKDRARTCIAECAFTCLAKVISLRGLDRSPPAASARPSRKPAAALRKLNAKPKPVQPQRSKSNQRHAARCNAGYKTSNREWPPCKPKAVPWKPTCAPPRHHPILPSSACA